MIVGLFFKIFMTSLVMMVFLLITGSACFVEDHKWIEITFGVLFVATLIAIPVSCIIWIWSI